MNEVQCRNLKYRNVKNRNLKNRKCKTGNVKLEKKISKVRLVFDSESGSFFLGPSLLFILLKDDHRTAFPIVE